ncbi:hypothetical protein [uncultured Zhongshania sp.]|uniref:hypothetical protein n=1 Tax=uncultured Zhongshania sp. TaxID=1642288 RepID=UPI0030D84CE1
MPTVQESQITTKTGSLQIRYHGLPEAVEARMKTFEDHQRLVSAVYIRHNGKRQVTAYAEVI